MWIDGAGIRAGHKWRNEIADGIQVSLVCWLLLMSVAMLVAIATIVAFCCNVCLLLLPYVVILVAIVAAELLVFPGSLVSSM